MNLMVLEINNPNIHNFHLNIEMFVRIIELSNYKKKLLISILNGNQLTNFDNLQSEITQILIKINNLNSLDNEIIIIALVFCLLGEYNDLYEYYRKQFKFNLNSIDQEIVMLLDEINNCKYNGNSNSKISYYTTIDKFYPSKKIDYGKVCDGKMGDKHTNCLVLDCHSDIINGELWIWDIPSDKSKAISLVSFLQKVFSNNNRNKIEGLIFNGCNSFEVLNNLGSKYFNHIYAWIGNIYTPIAIHFNYFFFRYYFKIFDVKKAADVATITFLLFNLSPSNVIRTKNGILLV